MKAGGRRPGSICGANLLRLVPLCLTLLVPTKTAAQSAEATVIFGPAQTASRLHIRGATDIDALEPAIQAFLEAFPGLQIVLESWNTTDLYDTAAAACRSGAPEADLLISSAVDLLVKLVNDGCALPHDSAQTAALPSSRNWRGELFGFTREPVVMIYNRDLVPPDEAPRSRFDLIDMLRPTNTRFAGRIATYDIEASGVGYLLAFTDSQQATTFGGLLEAFARSGAVATCCSAEITQAVAEGRYLVAYNVLGSYALARAATDRRIAVVAPEDYTLVLSRAAMIPKNAANPTAAGLFIDFMLSDAGRAALAQRFLITGDGAGGLPEDTASLYRPIPLTPALLLGLDSQKRASFLLRWRAAFSP